MDLDMGRQYERIKRKYELERKISHIEADMKFFEQMKNDKLIDEEKFIKKVSLLQKDLDPLKREYREIRVEISEFKVNLPPPSVQVAPEPEGTKRKKTRRSKRSKRTKRSRRSGRR